MRLVTLPCTVRIFMQQNVLYIISYHIICHPTARAIISSNYLCIFFPGILATRTKSQIASIAVIFEKKYGLSLLEQVVSDMTTLLGKLITGKETGLGKLLTYRILPQDERGLTHRFISYMFLVALLLSIFNIF